MSREYFFLYFSVSFFCVMTPRSWESWSYPLERREELNVAVFSLQSNLVVKKAMSHVSPEDISRNCNGFFSAEVGGSNDRSFLLVVLKC